MPTHRVVVVLVALLPCVAVAQEIPWQAERVMLRRDGVRVGRPVAGHLMRQGKELPADSLYTVLRADGGLLELGDNLGWVARADVVRMADAAAFFTARIKEEPTAAKWYGRRARVNWSQVFGSRLTISLSTQSPAARPLDLPTDDLREAVRLNPKDVSWRASLAGAYMVRGELDKAAEECEIILRIAPQDAESHKSRGVVRAARKDWAGAVADLERAAELDPTSIAVQDALAMAYHLAKQPAKVEATLRRLIEMTATTSSDYLSRANARGITLDMAGMLVDLTEVFRLDPANVEARQLRGCLLRRQGEYRAALTEFRQVARFQPGDPASMRMEAFLLATCKEDSLRDGKRAVELAEKAVKLGGENWASANLEALAAAYAETGDFTSAVATQKRAMKVIEGQPNYYDEIGDLRWWLNQYERDQPRRE